jgi:hypothetical protein
LDEAGATRLAVEVADVLASLPEPLRKLAGLLMQGETLVRAAKVLGIHRVTARRRARRIGEALRGESRKNDRPARDISGAFRVRVR